VKDGKEDGGSKGRSKRGREESESQRRPSQEAPDARQRCGTPLAAKSGVHGAGHGHQERLASTASIRGRGLNLCRARGQQLVPTWRRRGVVGRGLRPTCRRAVGSRAAMVQSRWRCRTPQQRCCYRGLVPLEADSPARCWLGISVLVNVVNI